jgi:HSP90 family molecular chaperone
MDILLARKELDGKTKKVTLSKLKEEVKKTKNEIYYFDKDNSHKNMMSLVDSFENDGYNVHFREVKYGLADDEYMYEVHIM